MVAAAATTAAISFPRSIIVATLGPRFTGVGVVLPTVFLGLGTLFVMVLVLGVLETSLEGVDLPSCGLERFGVFVSTALFVGGFLEATSDFVLGASGLASFFAGGRARGDSADFLAAGGDGLVTSGKNNTSRN